MWENSRSEANWIRKLQTLGYIVGILCALIYGAASPFLFDDESLTLLARLAEQNVLLSAAIGAFVLIASVGTAVFVAISVASRSRVACFISRVFFLTLLAMAIGILTSIVLGLLSAVPLPTRFGVYIFGSIVYFAAGLAGILTMNIVRNN
jgi:hypothetical protein